jgi:hypothetical protein
MRFTGSEIAGDFSGLLRQLDDLLSAPVKTARAEEGDHA